MSRGGRGRRRVAVVALLVGVISIVGVWVVVARSPSDVTLVGAGDIAGCGFSADNRTGALIASIPGAVFAAGDNVYPDGTQTEYDTCYQDAWGAAKDRTHPVPGNHEYQTPGAAGYFGYFGAAAGTPGEGWYAYDLGAWRIYALNSNCSDIGGCGPGSRQEQWLRADLAANPRQCVAAIWHHPRFSSGEHGTDALTAGLWQALYDAGAELVIVGHDHDYERFAPMDPLGNLDLARGIREIVVGTGGVGHNTFPTVAANSERRDNSTFGVLKLTLRATSYELQFVPEAGGTFQDEATGTCH